MRGIICQRVATMSNPDLQESEKLEIGLDSIDVEQDPNYKDFIERQSELRKKLEVIWSDDNE